MHTPKRPLVSTGPKTRKQIADEYGISRKTLYNWLKEQGIQLPRRMLTTREQEHIYLVLGLPPNARGGGRLSDTFLSTE